MMKERRDVIRRINGTADGKKLFSWLIEQYDGNIFDPCPYKTAFRLGGREVVSVLSSYLEKEVITND